MNKKKLQREQLARKMEGLAAALLVTPPAAGWIKATRTALGITMQQLANKLSKTRQSVEDSERRESEGSITINALKETATALDMQLVYGFVPLDGTIDNLIERKASELAKQIVLRTSASMKLEDQENSKQRLEKAIAEKTLELKTEMPKILWD